MYNGKSVFLIPKNYNTILILVKNISNVSAFSLAVTL